MRSAVLLAVAAIAGVAGAGQQLMNLADKPARGGRFKTPTDLVWPAKAGEGDICLWAHDKMAALSITIDDNCGPDHDWWVARAKEYDLPLTWFLITDRPDGKNKGFDGTWAKYQELANLGHSIQSHTTNHNSDHNAKRELTEAELVAMYADSQKIVNENIQGQKCLTIAYPRGECKRDIAKRYYIAARGTGGVPNAANSIDYLNTGVGGFGQGVLEMLLDGHTDKGPKWLPPKTYLKRGWSVALSHLVGTGKTAEDKAKGYARMSEALKYLGTRRKELWCDTFVNVAKYGQERDTAKLTVKSSDASKIVFDLSDDMKDDLFDYPLTVKFRLPDGWKTVKATQGGKEIKSEFIEHDGAPYALVYAIPDRGETTITK